MLVTTVTTKTGVLGEENKFSTTDDKASAAASCHEETASGTTDHAGGRVGQNQIKQGQVEMRQITNQMTAYVSILIGVLFLTGKGLIIGIEGSEPSIISIPQSIVAGWSFVSLAFVMLIPMELMVGPAIRSDI